MEDEENDIFNFSPGGGVATEAVEDDIMQFGPQPNPNPTATPTDGVRRDAEGEEYQLPEALEWFENTWLGDIVQDAILYGKQGIAQRRVAAETAELLTGNYDSGDVQEYLEAVNEMTAQEQTAETEAFNKEIEENGGGFFGVLKATAANPTAAMGIMVTSLIAMTTPEALGSAGAVYGTGLAAGSVGGPVGTAVAAVLGAPAAVGTLSAMTDATLTFSDYIQTSLREKGQEFNEKNVNALLNNPKEISKLRTAAAARGVAIGVIDGLTLKLGGALTTKLLGKGIGKGTTALAATATEAVGGGVGEAAGQVAEIAADTRDHIDTTEIALESIAEIAGPGTAVQVAQVVKEGAKGEITGNEVKPTGDSKPSADLSDIKPTVETVSSLQSQGVIRQDVKPEITVGTIKRIAVTTVTAGLATEGVTIENITPEQIETVIPRIKQEVVNNLKAEGIITKEADIESKDITDLINRVTVEALAVVAYDGVEDVSASPTAEDTVAPEYTPKVKTASEIEAAEIIAEEIEIAQREVTTEIQAPRAAAKAVSELEAEGFQELDSPAIQTAVEIIPQIVIEESEAGNGLNVEAIVAETVNEIQVAGYDLTPHDIEAITPVIQRIAEKTVNEITPEGIEETPTPSLVISQLDALAAPSPDKPNFTIGPNDSNITEQQAVEHVETATDEELVNSNIKSDDPSFAEWIGDKVVRATIRTQMPVNVPNAERVVDLEVGLRRYKENESTVGKARAAEINRRIKNLAAGKPEMDGIITEATDTQPAKNNSVLGDETFAPVEKPVTPPKPKPEPKAEPTETPTVAPSIEEQHWRTNPNFLGELTQEQSKNYKGRRNQIKNITRGIYEAPITGNKFFVVNGGASPENFDLTIDIASAQGYEVTQHPLNPGEYLVHKPGAKLDLLGGSKNRALGVPLAVINGIQFFTETFGKKVNKGIRERQLSRWLDRHAPKLGKKGRVGLLQDVQTLPKEDKVIVERILREKFPHVELKTANTKRGKIQYFQFGVDPKFSLAETREKAKADRGYLHKAVKTLKKVFPKVEVIFERGAWRQAYIDLTLEGVRIPDGTKGFVYNDRVYLNPDAVTKDTPFHEYAHLWARTLLRENPHLWKRGVDLLKGTEYMRIVDNIPYYNSFKNTDPARFYEEVMANALGKRAADIFDTPAWKQWIQEFVDWIKYKLNIGSQNNYANLTLDDWLNIGASSILSGDHTNFEILPDFRADKTGSPVNYSVKEEMFEEVGGFIIDGKSLTYGFNEEGEIIAYYDESGYDATQNRSFGEMLQQDYPKEFGPVPDIAPSIAESTSPAWFPSGLDAHYANAKKWVSRDKSKPKGWAKLPEWQQKVVDRAQWAADKQAKKDLANKTKKPVEPVGPAMENPTFRKVTEIFADAKKRHTNWGQHVGVAIREISNERIARSLGKLFQDFESGDVGIQQFYSAAGQRMFPKRPDGMTKEEHKKTQLGVGALALEVLIEQGIVDLGFDFGGFSAAKKAARKKKKEIPVDAGYVIEIKNYDIVDGLADAVAIYPSNKPDFKEVYVGDQKPEKQDTFRSKEGLQLVSRDNETNRMSRESHPEVYDVKDKADSTRYVVDTEYLDFFKRILNDASPKIVEKLIKGGTEESKKAKLDTLNRSILNMERIGEQTFGSAHNFVHNGRLMNTSTDVSHQSSKNVLAAYSFEQKEPLGAKGWEWLQVLTQDTYGFSDKGINEGLGDTRADRKAAAEKNQEKWMEVAADPMGNLDYIMDADVPMLFLRHILEMKNALAFEGGKEAFPSGLPAHMDATTSGIQLLAGITKDANAAKIANLTNTDERFDSYSNVVVKFLENLQTEEYSDADGKVALKEWLKRQKSLNSLASKASEETDAIKSQEIWDKWQQEKALFDDWKSKDNNKSNAARAFWMQKDIQENFRKIFKKPVMTKYYSSKANGMSGSLFAEFKDKYGDKGLNRSFTYWLAARITQAADEVFDGPGRVMGTMQEIAKEVASEGQVVKFNNPVTGFTVVNDPRVSEKQKIRFNYYGTNEFIKKRNSGGKIHSNIAVDTEEKNVNKQQSQIAPLVVHSLDAALVHYVFLNADFPVQTIHDSFATNPANTQALYKLVREGFYEVTKGDILLKIMEEIYQNAGFADYKAKAKEKFDKTQIGNWDPKGVLENQYAFSAGVTDPQVAEKTLAKAALEQQSPYVTASIIEEQSITDSISLEEKKIGIESKPCK